MNEWHPDWDQVEPLKEALREYMAEVQRLRAAMGQAQEPVAWVGPSWLNPETRGWESQSFSPEPIAGWIPLYTATQPESVFECPRCGHCCPRQVECMCGICKLKPVNREPVAWRKRYGNSGYTYFDKRWGTIPDGAEPLFSD